MCIYIHLLWWLKLSYHISETILFVLYPFYRVVFIKFLYSNPDSRGAFRNKNRKTLTRSSRWDPAVFGIRLLPCKEVVQDEAALAVVMFPRMVSKTWLPGRCGWARVLAGLLRHTLYIPQKLKKTVLYLKMRRV